MWNLIVKALKDALKEKVTEMTKEEVKEWLDKLGVKVEEVTDEIIAKVEAQKALLDAETRRKTRLFWGPKTPPHGNEASSGGASYGR